MVDVKHCIAPLFLSTILKDFFTSFIVESKILRNHWLRNYFVKLVDRGECKIIGTRLMMFGRWIVEFLHKRTCRICSLLAFGELASGGFFHWYDKGIMTGQLYFSFRGVNSGKIWGKPINEMPKPILIILIFNNNTDVSKQ